MGNIISPNSVYDSRTNDFFYKNAPETMRSLEPSEGYTTPLVGFMIFTKWDRSIYPPRPCSREVTE